MTPQEQEYITLDHANRQPMPDADDTPTLNAHDDYSLIGGNLDDYMADFARPKEDMGIVEEPTTEEWEQEEPERPQMTAKTARTTARFLARTTDTVMATGLSFISHNDYKVHKADKEQLKELEDILAEYVRESGGDIPLWLQLVICLFTMYAVQIPGALRDRKRNANGSDVNSGSTETDSRPTDTRDDEELLHIPTD